MKDILTRLTAWAIVAFVLWVVIVLCALLVGTSIVHPHMLTTVTQKDEIRIPADVLAAKFGPKHPFWLKVKGPNPIFERAGYTFVVDIDGFGLYPPLYYDVMVYVDLDHDYHTNLYRLYTTKEEGVSVNLRIAGKPL